MSLLEVKNINAFYDNSQVLFNMSLDISKNKLLLYSEEMVREKVQHLRQ